MARVVVLSFVFLAVLWLAGCSLPEHDPDIVDGWAVGDRLPCDVASDCEDLANVALIELGKSEPGHAEIVTWEMHRQGYYLDHKTGHKILATTSGSCCTIWLARLADGRTVAVGVGYPGISSVPIASRLGPALTFFDLD